MTTYKVEYDARAGTYVIRDLRDFVNNARDTRLWHDRVGVPGVSALMRETLSDLYQVQDDLDEGDLFETPFGVFVCVASDVEALAGATRPASRHKGIVCPHCGFDGKDETKIRCTTGSAFAYLEDIVCYRHIIGFDEQGCLRIDGRYHTGEGFDDGKNPRVICGACCEEFPIPEEIMARVDWV